MHVRRAGAGPALFLLAALLLIAQPTPHWVELTWTASTGWTPSWDVGTTYNTGDQIGFGASLYQSAADSNIGNQPDLSPDLWTLLDSVNGYKVYRSTVSGGPYTLLASTADVTVNDIDVQFGVTYYYVVTATTTLGTESANSNETAAVIPMDRQAISGGNSIVGGAIKR